MGEIIICDNCGKEEKKRRVDRSDGIIRIPWDNVHAWLEVLPNDGLCDSCWQRLLNTIGYVSFATLPPEDSYLTPPYPGTTTRGTTTRIDWQAEPVDWKEQLEHDRIYLSEGRPIARQD